MGVTISYSDDECAQPHKYMKAVNVELMKAGVRGISIFVSSGDNGVVGSDQVDFCGAPQCSVYQPGFPVNSPYVTVVGGTTVIKENKGYKEIVSSYSSGSIITSGGGFSNFFEQQYQQKDVSSYIDNELLDKTNKMKRAYPDISASATLYPVFTNNDETMMYGTSASTPLVASIVSLLNQHRLERGRPSLGFINPLLYRMHEKFGNDIFRDVTIGDNGCGEKGQKCCKGYSAASGWDATTGLGTIRYEQFLSKLLEFDDQKFSLDEQNAIASSCGSSSIFFVIASVLCCVGFIIKRLHMKKPRYVRI